MNTIDIAGSQNAFASRRLAHQIVLLVEKSFLKRFCTRILFHSLWAQDGLTKPPTRENTAPWTGFQTLIKYRL